MLNCREGKIVFIGPLMATLWKLSEEAFTPYTHKQTHNLHCSDGGQATLLNSCLTESWMLLMSCHFWAPNVLQCSRLIGVLTFLKSDKKWHLVCSLPNLSFLHRVHCSQVQVNRLISTAVICEIKNVTETLLTHLRVKFCATMTLKCY